MRFIIILTALTIAALYATQADAQAQAQRATRTGGYCNPDRSKPCGNGCISLSKQCRTPWTTFKSGINPNKSSKPVYNNPKYVERAPKN